MIRVLLADDQALLRMGFRLILETEPDIEVAGEAADGAAGVTMASALHPDVASFEQWLREVLGRTAGEGPSVLLSTIHRIKGREWDHVIIFDASRGLFPHRLGNDEEGERRSFAATHHGVEVAGVDPELRDVAAREPAGQPAEIHEIGGDVNGDAVHANPDKRPAPPAAVPDFNDKMKEPQQQGAQAARDQHI